MNRSMEMHGLGNSCRWFTTVCAPLPSTLMSGRTTFVIAHRLSTITHADRIVLREDGRLVDQGTHEQLLEHSDRYRQMVFMQLQGETPAQPSNELVGSAGRTSCD